MKRKPAVAGYFYPGREKDLKAAVETFIDTGIKRERAYSVISPHAGFTYSGPVAGAVFSSVEITDRIVILGPNHHHVPSRFSIMSEGYWQTPMGEVPLDTDLARSIMKHSGRVVDDMDAHTQEHSLEVQLPFIQYFKPDFCLVPLSIAYFAEYDELRDLGRALAKAVKELNEDVLIVASTDMSHYVDQKTARKKDFMAIDKILEMDPEGLFNTVKREKISMCGFQPTVAAMAASIELGASKATLVKYQTSGDVTGDLGEVVGYAGMRIT